jgi:hypothetical protein
MQRFTAREFKPFLMQKILLSFIAAILFFSACRKQKDQQAPPPPDEKEYDIITTATLYDAGTRRYQAAWFLNGKRNILEAANEEHTFAYGIEKAGSDLYISGGFAYTDPSAGSDVLMPCYWKNGQKINLPVDGLDIDERCAAGDVKWFNNALYFIGDADLAPVIWKLKDGKASIIPVPFGDDVVDIRKASNAQVYNNQLYIGGNQEKIINGQPVFNAGYWTVGHDDKISFHVMEDNLPYALCFSISVTASGIFLAGEYSSTTNLNTKPVIWTSSGHLPVSAQFNPVYHRLHTCAPDGNGNLYMNVLDIQTYQPVIWKVPATGVHQLIKPAVPANAKGLCHGLSVADDELAYFYSYEVSNQHHAAYVFRGRTVSLEINNQGEARLNRINIFAK